MIIVCESCQASLDLTAHSNQTGPIAVKCAQCGHIMAGISRADDVTDTHQNVPRYTVPKGTIDAPDPEDGLGDSEHAMNVATRPADIIRPASGVQPLTAPVPLGQTTMGQDTAGQGRKRPPPLPLITPTGTTTGMGPPSLGGHDGLLRDTAPVKAVQKRRQTAEYMPDAPGRDPGVPHEGDARKSLSHTLDEMPTLRPSAPSLAQAVEHLTTGEIPKIERQAALTFADEEPPPKMTAPKATAPRPQSTSMVPGFLLGALVAGLAAFGLYTLKKPKRPMTPAKNAPMVVIDSTSVAALGRANMAMQQDSHEGRRYAIQAYRSALVAVGSTASEQIIAVSARLGLAQLNLDRAQNAAILKKATSAHLARAKEWLDAVEPTAGQSQRKSVLMARFHRLSGRFGLARDILKRVPAEKNGLLHRVETVLLSAPAADVDATARVRALESLDAVALAMPTVWAIRTQAAIALQRFEAARSLVLGAPKGAVRAHFLTVLKARNAPKMEMKEKEKTPVLKPAGTASDEKAGPESNSNTAKRRQGQSTTPSPVAMKKVEQPSKGRPFDALMRDGSRFLESGKVARATKKFESAAAARPRRPEPYAQLGWCAINLRSYGKAITHFKKSLQLKSTYPDGLFGLGVAYEKVGNRAEAVRVLKSYLRWHPRGKKARMIRHRLERLEP